MRQREWSRPFIALLLACTGGASLSCLGLFDTPPGILSGEWRAAYDGYVPPRQLLTLTLDEVESGSVTGTAVVLVGADTIGAVVSGRHDPPDVRMDVLWSDGSQPGVLEGWAHYRDQITVYNGTFGELTLVRLAEPAAAHAARP